jgi:hypothetical protein
VKTVTARRKRLVVGLVAAVALLAVAFAVWQGRDDAPQPGPLAGVDLTALGAQGSELVGLLRLGRDETFHARYRSTPPTTDEAGTQEVTIELWRKPPDQRQDVVVTAGSEVGRSSSFVRGKEAMSCVEEAPRRWTCRKVAAASDTGPDAFLARLVSEASGPASDPRDDTVAGTSVRCFNVPLPSGTAEVCATRSGVPARIRVGPAFLELVELSSTVPDRVFTLPAKVS